MKNEDLAELSNCGTCDSNPGEVCDSCMAHHQELWNYCLTHDDPLYLKIKNSADNAKDNEWKYCAYLNDPLSLAIGDKLKLKSDYLQRKIELSEDYKTGVGHQMELPLDCPVDTQKDNVNRPEHYTKHGIECIDIINTMVADKYGMEAVCIANVVKYLYRYKDKGGIESVKKSQWYLNRLLKELEK